MFDIFMTFVSLTQALKTCMQALLSHAGDKHSDKAAAHMNPFVSLRLLRELGVPPAVQQAEHSTFFALNERIVAAESCWFAAKVRGGRHRRCLAGVC